MKTLSLKRFAAALIGVAALFTTTQAAAQVWRWDGFPSEGMSVWESRMLNGDTAQWETNDGGWFILDHPNGGGIGMPAPLNPEVTGQHDLNLCLAFHLRMDIDGPADCVALIGTWLSIQYEDFLPYVRAGKTGYVYLHGSNGLVLACRLDYDYTSQTGVKTRNISVTESSFALGWIDRNGRFVVIEDQVSEGNFLNMMSSLTGISIRGMVDLQNPDYFSTLHAFSFGFGSLM